MKNLRGDSKHVSSHYSPFVKEFEMKHRTPVDMYYVGQADGLANRPKQRLKGGAAAVYNNGYAAGHKERSQPKNQQQSKTAN